MTVRVVGVGSPFGDDAVGLRVAEEAALRLGPAAEVRLRDRPGLSLLEDLVGAERVVLVDGVRGLGPPGTVRVLRPEALLRARAGPGSSHGFGVREALRLALALGRRPGSLELVAVEVGDVSGSGMGRSVRAAIPEAVEVVVRRVAAARESGERTPGGGRRA